MSVILKLISIVAEGIAKLLQRLLEDRDKSELARETLIELGIINKFGF